MRRASIAIGWIRALAAPYLRGYRGVPQTQGALKGYWFLAPSSRRPIEPKSGPRKGCVSRGFFVGYLTGAADFDFLHPELPECLIFAFALPVGGPSHEKLVASSDSLVRKTFEYIRWLTHRPPRFVFHPDAVAAMTRHVSMKDWPVEKYQHFSRNFFVETLAWLVRSGLVRKFFDSAETPQTKFVRLRKSIASKK